MTRIKKQGILCFGHMYLPTLIEKNIISQRHVDKSFKFCFVRNPWDHAVSLYEHIIAFHKEKKMKIFGEFDTLTFERFWEEVARRPQPHVDEYYWNKRKYHMLTNQQIEWITDRKGNIMVDFIGRFENLQNDFDEVCKRIGIAPPPKLPKFNASKRRPYKKYYNKKTKALIAKLYKDDIKTFKYKF